jgi:1-acyl-sn-glycerol-3-phosphate acyltransferase
MEQNGLQHPVLVFLHTVFIYIGIVVSTFVLALVAIAVSFFSRTGDSVHLVARFWARTILWMSFIPVEVRGKENLDPHRSCIYMSNHQSNYDIPVLLSWLPVQFRWLAKAELFNIPIFGRGMRGAGYISIDRSNRKSAFQSLARAAESIRAGTSVLIFPEGTRSSNGGLQPFKKGGFVLAVDAAVLIVPIIIHGTFAIMPKKGWAIRRRPVVVEILPPIDASQYTRKNKDDLMDHLSQVMSARMPTQTQGGGHA